MARYQERIDQDKALSSVIEICLVRICSKQIRTKQNASLAPFSALFRCKFAIIFIDVASIEYKALCSAYSHYAHPFGLAITYIQR